MSTTAAVVESFEDQVVINVSEPRVEEAIATLPPQTRVAYLCGDAPTWRYLRVAHQLQTQGVEELYCAAPNSNTMVMIYDHGICRSYQ